MGFRPGISCPACGSTVAQCDVDRDGIVKALDFFNNLYNPGNLRVGMSFSDFLKTAPRIEHSLRIVQISKDGEKVGAVAVVHHIGPLTLVSDSE